MQDILFMEALSFPNRVPVSEPILQIIPSALAL